MEIVVGRADVALLSCAIFHLEPHPDEIGRIIAALLGGVDFDDGSCHVVPFVNGQRLDCFVEIGRASFRDDVAARLAFHFNSRSQGHVLMSSACSSSSLMTDETERPYWSSS